MICRSRLCCFAGFDVISKGAGCTGDPAWLCDVYDVCKVLVGTSRTPL